MSFARLKAKALSLQQEQNQLIANRNIVLSPEEIKLKEECEQSLVTFIKTFWDIIEGDNKFYPNWHINDIAAHLEAGIQGKIRYLVINIPFRCMKSLICNVFFPAWQWSRAPGFKIFCLTGDKDLALRDSVKCKRVIESPLYQRFWGRNFQLRKDINTASRYSTTKGGERMIKSIAGNAIGHGAHILIIDDINRQDDIMYKNLRDRTNAKLETSVLVRQDNTTSAFVIFIMQRLHEEDATNLLLSKKLPGTAHLMLPMEFEPDRQCSTIPLIEGGPVYKDPRTKAGELLWPTRFPSHYVAELKKILRTNYNISSQLQQNPTPDGGNYFRREWFNFWEDPRAPSCEFVLQSWDTALSTGIEACESACTTWGIFRKQDGALNIILLNCWTGRLEQPELRKMIVNSARNYHCRGHDDYRPGPSVDMVIIEEVPNSKGMIQDLRPSGIPIFGFSPRFHGLAGHKNETNKQARASLASVLVEQGLVWLPMKDGELFPFAKRVFTAALACPTGKDQDIIDSLSQAFIEIRRRELVLLPDEIPEEAPIHWQDDPNLQKYMGALGM